MDKFLTTDNGGLPLVLDDLRWFLGQDSNHGIYQALNNQYRGFGDNFIITGCIEGGSPGAVTLTEGWIILDGELLKVDAQSAFNEGADSTFVKVVTTDTTGDKTFQDASSVSTYQKNRAVISGVGGTLDYNGLHIWDVFTKKMRISGTERLGENSMPTLVRKIIDIGDWNMDSDQTKAVAHGLSASAIRSITATIRKDAAASPFNYYQIDFHDGATTHGGVGATTSTDIQLKRTGAGFFDSTDFNSTSYNRGWITIWSTP